MTFALRNRSNVKLRASWLIHFIANVRDLIRFIFEIELKHDRNIVVNGFF